MRVYSARLALFLVWAGVFVFYVVLFFLLQVLKRDQIEFEQTADSCWKVMYVLTPVLSAFGMYWFMPQAENAGQPAPQDDQVLDHARVIAMFTITGVVHFVVLLYFLFGVAFTDFQAPNNTASYTDRVDSGIKILVFLSSLVGLPVGFLLGRPIPPATAPAPFASGAGKQPPAPVE